MVVTPSLARGAVREAIRGHSLARQEMKSRARKAGLEAPGSLRGFNKWFRRREAIHNRDALLIAYGMVGRRTGGFAAYNAEFFDCERGWDMRVSKLLIEFSAEHIERVNVETLPACIPGHALERMFQRTESIDWASVRHCLAGATRFLNAVASAYLASKCMRCAIPAERGLLVGQVEDGELLLKTFISTATLGPRWAGLYDDLRAFEDEHAGPINEAALVGHGDVAESFARFLDAGRRRWLFDPYAPGEDVHEEAWRSRALAAA